MQTILTSDTINQGRVKVNDNTAKSVTGATTGTQSGQLDFKTHDPIYNFSASVNLPNIYEGGIIDGMAVTQSATNPLVRNIASGTYVIGGSVYSYAGGSVTLSAGPNVAVSPGRADLIIATSAGVTTIAGSANSTTPKTPLYQESSQLPLAVVIAWGGSTTASTRAQVTKCNMNFGGRMHATGDTPYHSVNSFVGSNGKGSIAMCRSGYLDSEFSYIFGGSQNIISGTTTSGPTAPIDVIVGGATNIIGPASFKSTIVGSDVCAIYSGYTCSIFGSYASNIRGKSGVSSVGNSSIIGCYNSSISGLTFYSSIFSSFGGLVRDSEITNVMGGNAVSIYSGYTSLVMNGEGNTFSVPQWFTSIGDNVCTTSNSYSSVTIGNTSLVSAGMTDSILIGTKTSTASTVNATGSYMLRANSSSLLNGAQDSGIIGANTSSISGASSNSVILGGRNSRITQSNYSLVVGEANEAFDCDDTFISGIGNTASTVNFGFVGGVIATAYSSDYAFLAGGSGNTIGNSQFGGIISGQRNTITSSTMSYILGGNNSLITGTGSSTSNSYILGGYRNTVSGNGNFIINGKNVTASANNNVTYIGLEGFNDSTLSTPSGATVMGDTFITNGQHLSNVIVATSGTTTGTTRAGVYLLNSAAGPITFYLPASSTVSNGYTFTAKDYAGSASTYNITVQGNGTLIDNISAQTMSTGYQAMRFHYSTTTGRWHII